jgi:hypothetical protein
MTASQRTLKVLARIRFIAASVFLYYQAISPDQEMPAFKAKQQPAGI